MCAYRGFSLEDREMSAFPFSVNAKNVFENHPDLRCLFSSTKRNQDIPENMNITVSPVRTSRNEERLEYANWESQKGHWYTWQDKAICIPPELQISETDIPWVLYLGLI